MMDTERVRAEQMIQSLGKDPLQILALESENIRYFFGPDECGVICYTLSGRRAMSLGDPICEAEDTRRLIASYFAYCEDHEYRCIFNSVNQDAADALRAAGYFVAKYGEEAILDLADYTLSGSQRGAMRRNVAKLDRLGCTSREYRPAEERDHALEEEILALQNAWQDEKQMKLTYSVGELQLDHPCGRRYFLTSDAEGRLLTVTSWLPYAQNRGWCIDVMYRQPDGPTGAMEHAIISAVSALRADGAREISLNLAPLAGIDVSSPETSQTERFMHAAFCSMDYGYDFQGLYRYKEKFGPSLWRPRYLACDRRISTVRLATSIANVKGARDMRLMMHYTRCFVSAIPLARRK